MSLKSKLILGLSFLFTIILVLISFYAYYIGQLANESSKVLKDNNNSLEYSKNLLFTLDNINMEIFKKIAEPNKGKELNDKITERLNIFFNDFEKNINSEENNITENGERELVLTLKKIYSAYHQLLQSGLNKEKFNYEILNEYSIIYLNLKETIDKIYKINMDAIIRKNNITTNEAKTIITNTSILGSVLLVIAFLYLWYFPFYLSNSILYISNQAKEILQKSNNDFKIKDEMKILLNFVKFTDNKYFSVKDEKS